MIDGHMHLENGPLTKEYVLEFVEEAHKKGIDKIQILDHTHRFIEFEPIYMELKDYEQDNEPAACGGDGIIPSGLRQQDE